MTEKSEILSFLDPLAKVVGITASLSVLVSIIYDWGYFTALGLNFAEVPTSLADHIRSSLIWLPKIIITLGLVFFFELLTRRIEQGMTEEEIIQSSSNPELTRKFRESPYKFILYFSFLVPILYILMGDFFIDILPFALIILWFAFGGWVNSHPRILARRHRIIRLAIYWLPPIGIWIFFGGYHDAIKAFTNNTPTCNIYSRINPTEPAKANILRVFDKVIVIKETNESHVKFMSSDDILKIETQYGYKPLNGKLVEWLSLSPLINKQKQPKGAEGTKMVATGELNVGWIALIAALSAAIVTAILSYLINIKLAKRAQKIREQQIAYVYLVKVSQIVAIEIFIKNYISTFLGHKEKLKIEDEKFEISHAICALIAEGFKKIDSKQLEEVRKIAASFQGLKLGEYFGEIFNFKIPDDLLAQFPRSAILYYSFCLNYAVYVKSIPTVWLNWIQTGDSTLINAEFIYGQWMAIKNLANTAEALRKVLIIKGGLPPQEASDLLHKQIEELNRGLFENLAARPKLEAALASIKKEMEKSDLSKPTAKAENP